MGFLHLRHQQEFQVAGMIVEECDECGQELPKDLDLKDWTEYNKKVVEEYIKSQKHLQHLIVEQEEES